MTSKPNDVRVSRELLPCPFCGSLDVKIATDDGIHFAQCCKCEATGPTGFKRGDEGDADWNNRAQPADQQGEPVLYQIRSKTDRPGSQWTPWRECTDEERAMHSCEAGAFNRFGIMREIRALCVQPATAKVDEQAEFDKAWPNISLGGVENGWRGVALAAWKARAKLNGVSKVLLPDHKDSDLRSSVYGYARGWNACLDEVAKLNTPQ
ncbi:hypothetical protein V2I84_05395 [Pseudomonas viridiflava]|uniref:hypothetical protein n=1 Tax=Pseudomonas viridiflava TaxID=33069 RepID=UPI002ECBB49A|nr:hypothetical protein [Pseudomonas viridiflava]MEE3980889.1 hypothetical protein [Pseudomonas viridiflava]MEE3989623.1 hypothetical protein [Pseudomonas viridiflava]MEE4028169.1 hypothetical protein [Pseudomonas viridiflava]MEE4034333.1 hypothetical protein [Pseudomonas viridiflava]